MREKIWGASATSAERLTARTRRERTGRARSRGAPRFAALREAAARSPDSVRDAAPAKQMTFAERATWGGPRAGAGPKASLRPKVRHRTRPIHKHWVPSHVTLRRSGGLPSFRAERLRRLLELAIRDTRRDGFRIVEYSVQADHVHLMIEAEDNQKLTNGMRSFAIRVAVRVNRRIFGRRRGRVWADRYHRRDLGSKREVRNALVYILANHLKHGELDVGLLDPCSSGPWFQGWIHVLEPPSEPRPTERAMTWLLRTGWQTLGFIHLGEMPRAVRRPIALS